MSLAWGGGWVGPEMNKFDHHQMLLTGGTWGGGGYVKRGLGWVCPEGGTGVQGPLPCELSHDACNVHIHLPTYRITTRCQYQGGLSLPPGRVLVSFQGDLWFPSGGRSRSPCGGGGGRGQSPAGGSVSVSSRGGALVSLQGGLGRLRPRPPPSVNRMTHASKNITFPQLRWWMV